MRYLMAVALAVALAGCAAQKRTVAPEGTYAPASFKVTIGGVDGVVQGSAVTAQFFAAEHVTPLMGRFFIDTDYASEPTGVAVLSHPYWVDRFQSAPTVIGSTVVVDGRSRVIVGVAPASFDPPRAGLIWIPKHP